MLQPPATSTERCLGAPERFLAASQGGPYAIDCLLLQEQRVGVGFMKDAGALVDQLLAFDESGFHLILSRLALVRDLVSVVGDPIPLVRERVPLVRDSVPVTRDSLAGL